VDVAVLAVDPDAVLLFVRLLPAVDDGVTEDEAVFVTLGLADSVGVILPVEESSGDRLIVTEVVDVLDVREEYDCVAEPVVVFETEVELVIVFDETIVIDIRGVTLQHEERVILPVTDMDPQPLPVEVGAAVSEVVPVLTADTLKAELLEGVAVPTRVGRAVAEPDAETVAVLRAATELVPVPELVVVFETLMLRVCVGDALELRDWKKLRVRFAERLAVFVLTPERVVVFDLADVTLTVGVEVPVRELFRVAVPEGDAVDVLEDASVLVPV